MVLILIRSSHEASLDKLTFALFLDAWFREMSQFQMTTKIPGLFDYGTADGTRGWLFGL